MAIHLSEDLTVAWKRVVQGVREMCDVSEATLFNKHWACGKCGFVVCIDCYRTRTNGDEVGADTESDTAARDRDRFSWLFCTNRYSYLTLLSFDLVTVEESNITCIFPQSLLYCTVHVVQCPMLLVI